MNYKIMKKKIIVMLAEEINESVDLSERVYKEIERKNRQQQP